MKFHQVIRHSADFLILLLIIGLSLAGLVYFRFDTAAQIAVVFIMAIFYIFWGVFHHFHEANLTAKVILEYISLAALVAFILILFLLRV